jgi:hypothetical protein
MEISNEERIEMFQKELNLIYDEGIREFTKLVLTQMPAYFFLDCPILHDGLKQGKVKTGHTVKNHPGLAADLIKEVQEATQMLSDESYNVIRNCVGFHYGPWSISPWAKKLSQFSPAELTLYISDYTASKRCVDVDYRR